MPIHVAVQTELDERAANDQARMLESVFAGAGSRAAAQFMGGLSGGLAGSGRALSGLTSLAESMGVSMSAGAATAAAGIAGIGAAAVVAGKQLYDLGASWDQITDNITISTGKVGAELDSLRDVVKAVGSDVADSMGNISAIVSQLSVMMPALDTGQLRAVADDLAFLDAHGQSVNVRELSHAFSLLNVQAKDAHDAFERIAAASRASGIPITELVSDLANVGRAAALAGLDLNQTLSVIVAIERSGGNLNTLAPALSIAFKKFAADGRDAGAALRETVNQMDQLIRSGKDTEALALAAQYFGRSYRDVFNAVKDGTLNVDTLTSALKTDGKTLDDIKNKTDDLGESWNKLTNTLGNVFEPVASRVFNTLNSALSTMLDKTRDIAQFLGRGGNPQNFPSPPVQPGSVESFQMGLGTGPWAPTGPGAAPPTSIGGGVWGSPGGPNAPPQYGGWSPPTSTWGGQGTTGGGPPRAPQVPYPAEYTTAPMPGETVQQWQDRLSRIRAQHDVDEARARLDQLERDNTSTAEQIADARNALIDKQIAQTQNEARLNEAKKQNIARAEVPYPAGYGGPAMAGETKEQYDRRQAVLKAQHDQSQALARLQQTMADPAHTAEQLTAANNDLAEANKNLQDALLGVNDQTGKAADALGDFGVKLDQDFGISKGLPGLAENLVRFLGSLAFAPAMGAMRGVQAGLGFPGGNVGGASGLIGMAALANLPPGSQLQGGAWQPGAFPGGPPGGPSLYPTSQPGGSPFAVTPGGQFAPASYNTNIGSVNTPADLAAGGNRVSALYALASSLQGTPYSQALRNDCSGMVSQLAAAAVGLPPPPASERFNTTNEGQWLAAHGFQPGIGPPGSFQVGWNPAPGNAGHTAATLPGGVNVEQGGANSSFTMGPGAQGGYSDQFPMHAYLPMGGNMMAVRSQPPPGRPPQPGEALNTWGYSQLIAAGLSPDEARGILAMNTVEGGATLEACSGSPNRRRKARKDICKRFCGSGTTRAGAARAASSRGSGRAVGPPTGTPT